MNNVLCASIYVFLTLELLIPHIVLASEEMEETYGPDDNPSYTAAWTATDFFENEYYYKGGPHICYAGTFSVKSDPSDLLPRRGYISVRHHLGEKTYNVFSYSSAYTFQSHSKPVLQIGRQHWELFSFGYNAYAQSKKTDQQIASALSRPNGLFSISGYSSDGRLIKEFFSTGGAAKALKEINMACGFDIHEHK